MKMENPDVRHENFRQFLDRLPLVIQAKADPGAQAAGTPGREISQLLDATLQHRRVLMRYHSFSMRERLEKALPKGDAYVS